MLFFGAYSRRNVEGWGRLQKPWHGSYDAKVMQHGLSIFNAPLSPKSGYKCHAPKPKETLITKSSKMAVSNKSPWLLYELFCTNMTLPHKPSSRFRMYKYWWKACSITFLLDAAPPFYSKRRRTRIASSLCSLRCPHLSHHRLRGPRARLSQANKRDDRPRHATEASVTDVASPPRQGCWAPRPCRAVLTCYLEGMRAQSRSRTKRMRKRKPSVCSEF